MFRNKIYTISQNKQCKILFSGKNGIQNYLTALIDGK